LAPLWLALTSLGAVGATWTLKQTRFDYDFAALEDSKLPSFTLDAEVNRLLGRSQTPLVALAEHEARIAAAIRAANDDSVQMVVSLGDLVPPNQLTTSISGNPTPGRAGGNGEGGWVERGVPKELGRRARAAEGARFSTRPSARTRW
jgi:hypothetical protein